jgi:kanamycin kinase
MRSDFATIPPIGTPVPAEMAELAGEPVTLVWRNDAGGLTGRVDGAHPRYIKWNPAGSGESLAREAERLRWLEGRHPAPVVIELVETDEAELLVTRALPGTTAVDDAWLERPVNAVRAIANGLRLLHALAVDDCPFDWGVASRINEAATRGMSVPLPLGNPPAIDRLVVCHGDPCAPNTLVGEGGEFVANVDFGRLGVADRWADLAVATMSLGWNYDEYDEGIFWETYGVEPDVERIVYYRALWNAT